MTIIQRRCWHPGESLSAATSQANQKAQGRRPKLLGRKGRTTGLRDRRKLELPAEIVEAGAAVRLDSCRALHISLGSTDDLLSEGCRGTGIKEWSNWETEGTQEEMLTELHAIKDNEKRIYRLAVITSQRREQQHSHIRPHSRPWGGRGGLRRADSGWMAQKDPRSTRTSDFRRNKAKK